MKRLIKSREFFNGESQINESTSSAVSVSDIPTDALANPDLAPDLTAYKTYTKNLHVYDYPALGQATAVVYNTLKNKAGISRVIVDPLAINIDGVVSAVIYIPQGTFTITHDQANTIINFYAGSTFRIGSKVIADFSTTTSSNGIRQSLIDLIDYMTSLTKESFVLDDADALNEAKSNKNYLAIANNPDLLLKLQSCITDCNGSLNAAAKKISEHPEDYDSIFNGVAKETIYKWLGLLSRDKYIVSLKSGFADSIKQDQSTDIEPVDDTDAIEKAFEEERQKYIYSNEFIRRSVGRMCEYVKSKGRVIPPGFTRGLYIIGKAGSGKSYSTELTLDEHKMVRGKDYILWKNASSQVSDLYDKFYEYNGKLIILDDAAGVVSGESRVAFWKEALQTRGGRPRLPQGTVSNDNVKYYSITSAKNRKERYYLEMGNAEAIARKSDTYKTLRAKSESRSSSEEEREQAKSKMEALIAKAKENAHPRIPDEFDFTGCVIVIGNCTEAELQKKVLQSGGGAEDWKAISQRFGGIIVVAPPARVLWSQIRQNILSKANSSTPDCLLDIPRDKSQWFVELVDSYMNGEKGAQYNDMSWRMPSSVGPLLREMDKNQDWLVRLESILKDAKDVSTDFNRSNPLINKKKF